MIRTFLDALPQRRGQSIMRNKTQSSARSAKYLALLFAVLVMSIGNVWGA